MLTFINIKNGRNYYGCHYQTGQRYLQTYLGYGWTDHHADHLTVLALLFGVKFSKALEGGIKLAIALTGIGAIIGMLNGAFSASLAKFVENTGIQLNITDVGWAPLATITWGSAWTLYFLLIMLIVNIVMLAMKKTDTLDVDIFDIWHLSITGLLIKWYADNNGVSQGVSLFIATAAVAL